MTAKTEKAIESIIYAESQSINYREIYMLGKTKIKLELKSDSYNEQSYATAYALDGLEWKLIYSIPYSQMKTESKLIYKMAYKNDNEAKNEFELDVQRLKEYIR